MRRTQQSSAETLKFVSALSAQICERRLMSMEREKIIAALETAFAEISGAGYEDEPETFAEFLESFKKFRDPDFPVYWIPWTVEEAVEELTGRQFGWHEDAFKDEWNYTGEFGFVCVDPETLRCLTAERTDDERCAVSVVFPILEIDDAVQAVEYFLRLVQQA
jgi:hypothetical protein